MRQWTWVSDQRNYYPLELFLERKIVLDEKINLATVVMAISEMDILEISDEESWKILSERGWG